MCSEQKFVFFVTDMEKFFLQCDPGEFLPLEFVDLNVELRGAI